MSSKIERFSRAIRESRLAKIAHSSQDTNAHKFGSEQCLVTKQIGIGPETMSMLELREPDLLIICGGVGVNQWHKVVIRTSGMLKSPLSRM